MKIKSALQKGKDLENFIVDRLRATGLDRRAYRQKGSGNGLHKGDVWNDLGICFEAKNTKQLALKSTLQQVNREALGTQAPVIVWHMPQTPLEDSYVVLDWHYFEQLLMKSRRDISELENLDKATSYKLRTFLRVGRELLKELE